MLLRITVGVLALLLLVLVGTHANAKPGLDKDLQGAICALLFIMLTVLANCLA